LRVENETEEPLLWLPSKANLLFSNTSSEIMRASSSVTDETIACNFLSSESPVSLDEELGIGAKLEARTGISP